MNKKFVKPLIILAGVIFSLYILFLALPLLTKPLFAGAADKISAEIEKQTGFKTEINDFTIITTPKFTVGAKIGNIKIKTPDNREFISAENAAAKMSLLPLLIKRIEADVISADSISADLYVKSDGHFKLEDFINELIEKQEKGANKADKPEAQAFELPLGLKLSDKLPNVRVKKYAITFIEDNTGKKYKLEGANTNVTDFVINKKVKITSKGKLTLDGADVFNYDIKIFNKIMPDIHLNDMLTAEPVEAPKQANDTDFNFDIIKAFKSVKTNGLKANAAADIKISGDINNPELEGFIKADGITMLSMGKKLPESYANIEFAKNKHKFDVNFYTAQNETTKLTGSLISGKKPKIDVTCKSNATLKSIFDIVNTVLMAANIYDMNTLTAKGRLDVDFNVKSDFKKVNSNGHLKLAEGMINYGLYNVKIDNIISNISLDNNTVNINNLGFSILSVPLTITGKITPDALCNLNINTKDLSIKGLLVSLGQAALLKENPISSGTSTVSINIADKLIAPKISGNISVNNFVMKNVPSDVTLSFNPAVINLKNTQKGFDGTIAVTGFKAVNPAVSVLAPSVSAKINESAINIKDSKVDIGKNSITAGGTISDYLTDKIALNFYTKGKITSDLAGSINPYKMTLDVKYSIPNNAEIIIPGFDKSKLLARGTVHVTGSMMNPVLKGQFIVPMVKIPEIPCDIKNMIANINGTILNGSALLDEFVTGGIKASDIKSDYKLDGNIFYLKNLMGKAFDGTFNGDIAYNIATGDCGVKFKGADMSALKAIEGAAGIKNALSGKLGFNADVKFKGVEYIDMMKTLKGSAGFEIKDGVLANLGGLKMLMNAQNIAQNSLLKSAANKTTALSSVEQASEFDYINGNLSFSNGYANLNGIKMAGPSMAYYVTGKYNLVTGSISAEVLGRLAGNIVNLMGGIGNLAVSKLSNTIPLFGNLTASLLKSMTESPKNVDVSKIPALRNSNTQYKDFKVVFNGFAENSGSVKSFKWIQEVDTSAIEGQTNAVKSIDEIKTQAKNEIDAAKTQAQNRVQEAKSAFEQAKLNAKTQAKEQAAGLLKSFLGAPSASTSSGN